MSRHVSAIYCDGIRHELGNKRSFMGVYQGEMIVQGFPFQSPKLCISLMISTPMERPFRKLHVKILKGDSTLAEAPLDEAVLSQDQDATIAANDGDMSETRISFNVELVFSPFVVEEPTKIRIRIQTEDEALKGPALKIRATKPS